MKKKLNGGKTLRLLLMTLLAVLMIGTCVQAAQKSGWVTNKKGYTSYYKKGKALKGLQKIGKRIYYFDEDGFQRVSWRKVDGHYYCFRSFYGKQGYMMTKTKKNGIVLGEDGAARLTSARAKKKAKTMNSVSEFMDEILEKKKAMGQKKSKKLKTMYDFLRSEIPYVYVCHFRRKDPNWDLWSVNYLLNNRKADCHPFAATFAYLANALGYGKIIVYSWIRRTTGHSWVKIDKKIYDVSLGRYQLNRYNLYGITEAQYTRGHGVYKKDDVLKLDRL